MIRSLKASLMILMILMTWNPASAEEIPLYRLNVRLLPGIHTIEGHGIISVTSGNRFEIDPAPFSMTGWRLDGKKIDSFEAVNRRLAADPGPHVLEFDYRKVFSGEDGENALNPKGVILLSRWYPTISLRSRYRLTVTLPRSMTAVSETESVKESLGEKTRTVRFVFPHAIGGITLAAGPYKIRQERIHGITLRVLFFAEDDTLAGRYLDRARRYIELYEKMLGPFPYPIFSIVENRYPTGSSFPTYTLLGAAVIRLPFILQTSLGHEILHQWFGNSLFVNNAEGNWSEGLTTYLADHWYKAQAGKGAAYRKKILTDYRNYVTRKNDFPLKDFRERTNRATQAIGYGKGAMFFHMLRRKVGDEKFFAGLKETIAAEKFKRLLWHDLEKHFSTAAGEDLAPFFTQWLERKGVPEFRVKNPRLLYRNGAYRLSFDLRQEGKPWRFKLPVTVVTPDGRKTYTFPVEGATEHWSHTFTEKPSRLIIDPNYDVMRSLTKEETPQVLSGFLGRPGSLVILPDEDSDLYRDAADLFRRKGFKVIQAKEVTEEDLRNHSALIFSRKNRIYQRLFAGTSLPRGDLVLKVTANPLNTELTDVLAGGDRPGSSLPALRKIFHYGNDAELVFRDGHVISRKAGTAEQGIVVDLDLHVEAVEPKKDLDLDAVVTKIRDRRLIFIGESHTAYAHHVVQREIIRRIFKARRKLIIGMEMFQRPYQEYLNQYIQGKIDEAEMLRKTEYFSRWKYEYNLYRDILQYARAKKIPVIALNLRAEIIRKVSRKGISSLTPDEAEALPRDIDMTNQTYRQYMQEIFKEHPEGKSQAAGKTGALFADFFQSQVLWDETMAHTIAETLRKHPDTPMVVLAGNGHLQYSWGIPDRVHRITGIRGTVILNDINDTIRRDLADYILFPDPMKTPESPKLMVMLSKNKNGIEVVKMLRNGPADKGGMREGDLILKIGKEKIRKIDDVKIALLGKKKGETIKVKIRRKHLFLGRKETQLKVHL
ncbi:MAG: PDZ domain-containing protein [Deltaproteobacteria bacterium]|nr:PDZ domain-containing protein [Deltaproteobacteria bacterium]